MFSPQNDGVPGTSTPIDLVFLRDFKDALRIVKQVLEKNKGFFYVFVGVALVEFIGHAVNKPVPFLDWGVELATLYAASSVIVLAYKELKPEFDETAVQTGVEKRIISTSVSVGISTCLLSLFFMVPGIWFATKSCLSTVLACLENCNAGEAIKRSHVLVRGNFMTVLDYAVFKPFLVWLAMTIIYFTVIFACSKLPGEDISRVALGAAEGAMILVNAMFQLSIFALLARLYAKLKHPDGNMVLPVVPSAALPISTASTPMPMHEIDDSKLNPRW